MGQDIVESPQQQTARQSYPRPVSYRRELLGFFIAAITPGLLIGASLSISAAITENVLALVALYVLPPVAAFFGLFTTVPAILVAGVPIYLLFAWLGWTDWPRFVLGGALIGWAFAHFGYTGVLPVEMWIVAILGDRANLLPAALQLGFALLGGASGSMLWFVLYTTRAQQAFLIKVALASFLAIGLVLVR